MKSFLRSCSSVRVRLTLWNTLTLAFVLVALGAAFRILAENSLLNALDRDIRMQAQQFQAKHQVRMMFVTAATRPNLSRQLPERLRVLEASEDTSAPLRSEVSSSPANRPMEKDTLLRLLPSGKTIAVETKHTINRREARYSIVSRIGATTGASSPQQDKSSQFLYRAFDLTGKPLSSDPFPLPFDFASLPFPDAKQTHKRLPDYRPWDQTAFAPALTGKEQYSTVDSEGTLLRVLSQPLTESEAENEASDTTARQRIIGVVQIAAPLGQVTRDIAGLTRTLLLILPLALLAAAGAGVFLTNAALRPVKSLAHAATHIHPEQLSQRLPVSGTDEFDELAGAFNHALDRVERTFREREQAMEQLRRFTADASHELRTPLTTIKANTGIALKETEPSEEHLHALRQINRAADRMTALVRDLLLLARADAGQVSMECQPLSLQAVLQEAIADMESAPAAEPRAAIELQVSAPPGASETVLAGNAEALHRLFLNLLQNAARHTPSDGHIVVTLQRQHAQAVVQVQDTGCGIAPEHLPHLGERFYRADAGRNRKQGGAGLGLAICRAIVAQHQGTLAIQSTPGAGTTITLHLPLTS